MMLQDRESLTTIAERDIDLLILEEANSNPEFQDWFIVRAKGRPMNVQDFQAYHSVSSEGRESDLIFSFRDDQDQVIAILIENKIDAIHQPHQADAYRQRGETGIARGSWAAFTTCIIAPNDYLHSSLMSEHSYDVRISYEEIQAFLWSRQRRERRFAYRARVIGKALEKRQRRYVLVVDDALTKFVEDYFRFVEEGHPELGMRPARPRASGNTWVEFQPRGYPAHIRLCHQTTSGFVKVFWNGAVEDYDDIESKVRTSASFSPDMELARAGKSVSLSVRVPPIHPHRTPFAADRDNVQRALEALKRVDTVVREAEGIR